MELLISNPCLLTAFKPNDPAMPYGLFVIARALKVSNLFPLGPFPCSFIINYYIYIFSKVITCVFQVFEKVKIILFNLAKIDRIILNIAFFDLLNNFGTYTCIQTFYFRLPSRNNRPAAY